MFARLSLIVSALAFYLSFAAARPHYSSYLPDPPAPYHHHPSGFPTGVYPTGGFHVPTGGFPTPTGGFPAPTGWIPSGPHAAPAGGYAVRPHGKRSFEGARQAHHPRFWWGESDDHHDGESESWIIPTGTASAAPFSTGNAIYSTVGWTPCSTGGAFPTGAYPTGTFPTGY